MRNASGLMAADLAHAQGFQECAQILANAQNLQQNTPQSHNRAFLNGMSQNGGHILPPTQGRSFLNGVPNRKRSFDGNEANPLKRSRPNGLCMPPAFLNGNGLLGGNEDAQMESMNMETATVTSGDRHCVDFSSNNQTAGMLLDQHICSQVEHQRSVKAEQMYDNTLYSTMLLYHGS